MSAFDGGMRPAVNYQAQLAVAEKLHENQILQQRCVTLLLKAIKCKRYSIVVKKRPMLRKIELNQELAKLLA